MKTLGEITLFLLLTIPIALVSQTTSPVPPPPTPALGQAVSIALRDMETDKKTAMSSYTQAQREELAVMEEWKGAHPGWHLDPHTFTPTPDNPADGSATKPQPRIVTNPRDKSSGKVENPPQK